MSVVYLDLTEKQWKIVDEVMDKTEKEAAYLATLSKEQRFIWFQNINIPILSALSVKSAAQSIQSMPISVIRPLKP